MKSRPLNDGTGCDGVKIATVPLRDITGLALWGSWDGFGDGLWKRLGRNLARRYNVMFHQFGYE